ncbi:hypothetical protein BJ742DRAFT_173052 [Cladochytrium replicatum]|nr:hypothetical protein BJ742DRAFT_173052 [Cladochytrium replicatum]
MRTRNAVQCGNVNKDIERVNDFDPEILEVNRNLYFPLQQQKLIEFIRGGQINNAIEFA